MLVLTNGVTEVLSSKGFDTIDYEWQEGATVTLTLFNEAGSAITDATDLPMVQVPGTSGRNTIYRVEISYTVTLPGGTEGEAIVTFTNTDGKRGKARKRVRYEA